jgi:putative ATP-dependent endonuclease of the OLD family
MFISELRVENFRMFGEGNDAFVLALEPGLTALVGENDNGKTSVIDALRLVLAQGNQNLLQV